MTALSAAGLPVYPKRAPGGSIALPGFWKTWCDEFESTRPQSQFPVPLRVSPTLAQRLSENRPKTLIPPPKIEPDGWQTLPLTFESIESARTRILGYGGAAKVLEPLALRRSIEDFARQTLARYAGRD